MSNTLQILKYCCKSDSPHTLSPNHLCLPGQTQGSSEGSHHRISHDCQGSAGQWRRSELPESNLLFLPNPAVQALGSRLVVEKVCWRWGWGLPENLVPAPPPPHSILLYHQAVRKKNNNNHHPPYKLSIFLLLPFQVYVKIMKKEYPCSN